MGMKSGELIYCKRVRGMFAFAIWDREKQELLGQEIISGIKPIITRK